MRPASFLLLSVALSGCYASHGLDADAGSVGEDAGVDAGSCFVPDAEIYVRNDCEFCNAFHYTWLRRCGSRVYLAGAFGAGVQAVFLEGECGALTLEACVGFEGCSPLSDCRATDVGSLEALLETTADWSPRGGALPFEPYDGEVPFGEPPTCEALAARASVCE